MFKEGRFYVIQARETDGSLIYLSYADEYTREKALRSVLNRRASSYGYLNDHEASFPQDVETHNDPFSATLWPESTLVTKIIGRMGMIRAAAARRSIDVNSIRLVIVEAKVNVFVPESPSEEETALRKFVMDKLSAEEKALLRVTHWDVYGKLADRGDDGDDEEEDD